jgi:hypothetical protein
MELQLASAEDEGYDDDEIQHERVKRWIENAETDLETGIAPRLVKGKETAVSTSSISNHTTSSNSAEKTDTERSAKTTSSNSAEKTDTERSAKNLKFIEAAKPRGFENSRETWMSFPPAGEGAQGVQNPQHSIDRRSQLLTPTDSHDKPMAVLSRVLPCDFYYLGCNTSFSLGQVEDWITHTALHFSPKDLAEIAGCPFYPKTFQNNGRDRSRLWHLRIMHIRKDLPVVYSSFSGEPSVLPDAWVANYLSLKASVPRRVAYNLLNGPDNRHLSNGRRIAAWNLAL